MLFVKDGGLFHRPNGFWIKGGSREISKYQHRTKRTGNHKLRNCPENLFDLGRRTMRHVDEKNLLTLVADEPKPIVQKLTGSGVLLGAGPIISPSQPRSLVIPRECGVGRHYLDATPPTDALGRTIGQ